MLPKVHLFPGERSRKRVLTEAESEAYLEAAEEIGEGIVTACGCALEGIRAVERGEQPIKPSDPYILRDVATMLLDCGLRPEEADRLRWDQIRDRAVFIETGKTYNARRMVPLSASAAALLEHRHAAGLTDQWVYPAPTRRGRMEQSSLNKRRTDACTAACV